jgi:hypothetical protein
MRLVIGLGTGRSGTVSLARFLDRQPGAFFSHEGGYDRPRLLRHTFGHILPWEPSQTAFAAWLAGLERAAAGASVYGDVAPYLLPYVERIQAARPGARFLCVRRAREEVVRSFLRHTAGTNPWQEHDGRRYLRRSWDAAFPKLTAASKAEAIARYWERYDAQAREYAARYPETFRIVEFAALNERATQAALLDFAGLPRAGRRYGMPRANGSLPAPLMWGLIRLGTALGFDP